MKNRYLVILDKVGMISDILYSKEEIIKYLSNETDSVASDGEDDEYIEEI